MLDQGGVKVCETALQTHPAHQGVSKNGRKALQSLTQPPGSASSGARGDDDSSDEEFTLDDGDEVGGRGGADDEECVVM